MREQEKKKAIITEAVRKSRKEVNVSEVIENPYLNEYETAAITGRAVSTLRNDRFLRRGIPYLKVSKRSIRYRNIDVRKFMEARPITFDEDTE